MRRASPKVLVLIAAVLTVALLAYVFAGGSSPDRLPRDRLTDQQAGMAGTSAIQPDSQETALTAPPPPPAPEPEPEPEVEPGPVTQPTPIVRPTPPAQPRPSADDVRRSERPKSKERAAPGGQRPAVSPRRTATAPAPAQNAIAKPSYNCRYARTRSEIAVCSDAGLARLDQQMAAQFNTALRQATPAQRDVLERSRLRFLYRRDRCNSASCIAETYRERMTEINDIAARHWAEPR